MDSIQVGDGRGRRRLIKPKTSDVKPFWINADGSIELDEEASDSPVMEMLQNADRERAEEYAKKYVQTNQIPCKGCQGKGTIRILRWDSLGGDRQEPQEETCRLCNGTGIHPDE